MAKAIEIRQAHFPARAPIEAYGNGGFRFADMSHKGSILCLPSGIYGWSCACPIPQLSDMEKILAEADAIEILLIGSGLRMQRLPEEIRSACRARSISTDVMSTGAAVRTFNVLLAENRAVAAALMAVE